MKVNAKDFVLNLRLQYYIPFALVGGYLIWYPTPESVQANEGSEGLPVLEASDPNAWPTSTLSSQQPPVNTSPSGPSASNPAESALLELTASNPIDMPPPLLELPALAEVAPTPQQPTSAPIETPPPLLELTAPAPKEVPPTQQQSPPVKEDSPTISPTSPTQVEPSRSTGPKNGLEADGIPPSVIPQAVDLDAMEQAESAPQAEKTPIIPEIINPYQPDDYRLTIGDTISVFVANIPEFTTENIIASDGKINLPVAGPIYLWDMTLEEAEIAITQHYVQADVLRNPDISVKLLASSPLKIAVAGEINRPGAYDVPVLDKKLPTITEAIKIAGGIASEADLKNIELYRHNRAGGQDLYKLNLFALYKQADLSQNITLRSGDRIIIPKGEVRPEEAQLIGSANISPDTMQIGILGEVLSPGIIQSPTNTALNQALILVGGFNSRAKKTVQLVRTNDDGTVTREKIKIDWAANVGDERNPILQHRDVVLVGPNAIAKYSDFLDKAIGPINRTIPFIGILDLLFPGRSSR